MDTTDIKYNMTLHKLFENAAADSPSKVALIHGNKSLNYQNLNNQSNQLARFLNSKISDSSSIVALFFDKGIEMIISILGVWKSGAAYVPIDPSYPDERIKFILEDTKATIILTSSKYITFLNALMNNNDKMIIVNMNETEEFEQYPTDNLNLSTCHNESHAYMMYTSGSTGTPKGILKTHKNAVYGIINISNQYKLLTENGSSNERIVLFSSYVYEPFLRQMLMALLNGHSLVIVDDEIKRHPKEFSEFLIQNSITLLNGTATSLQEYDYTQCISLKKLIFAGEELTSECYKTARKTFKGEIINEYGPTECTFVSCLKFFQNDDVRNNRSIGKPMNHVKCYVLNDDDMKQCDTGVIGELYISGAAVAEGYFNLPNETEEKFLKNPFHLNKNNQRNDDCFQRIYKTGDLARWLPDGEIEFFGRNDFQIKINGIRIEPGETEATILRHQSIKKAIVVTNIALKVNTDDKFLIGFYLPAGGDKSHKKVNGKILKTFLLSKLPPAMIPRRLIEIHEIPKSINGKLDFAALSKIYKEYYYPAQMESCYIPPKTVLQQKLCHMWSKLLKIPVEEIGIEDDFFNLGGDSIMTVKLYFKILRKFSLVSNVTTIFTFQHRTIESISKFIENNLNNNLSTSLKNAAPTTKTTTVIPKNGKDEEILSFEQEGLLFIDQYEGGTNAWNICMHYSLNPEIDMESLKGAFLNIIKRHDTLRTIIVKNPENQQFLQKALNFQKAAEQFVFQKVFVQNNAELEKEMIKASSYQFDVQKDIPIRVTYYYNENNNQNSIHLTIIVHHIFFDGWSRNILENELFLIMNHLKNDSRTRRIQKLLPSLDITYKDYAAWQRKEINSEKLKELMSYWKEKLKDFEALSLAEDFSRPLNFDYSAGCQIKFELSKEISDLLKELAKQLKVSLYSILLGTYCIMLSNFSNQQSITIGTPVTLKNQVELENVIGFFVNMIVFTTTPQSSKQQTFLEYFQSISNEIIQAQTNKELPFQKLVKELFSEQKDSSRHPIVQVIFNMDETFKSENEEIVDEDDVLKLTPFNLMTSESVIRCDLETVIQSTKQQNICGYFNYYTKVFHSSTINNMIESYSFMLEQIANSVKNNGIVNLKINDLELINSSQKRHLKSLKNETIFKAPEFSESTLHEIFDKIVEKFPSKIALTYGNNCSLTYLELQRYANNFVVNLQQQQAANIQPDSIIALLLNKTQCMIISILGVWKSGAAYVPIDPSYPDERIKFILEDTKAEIVITNTCYLTKLQNIPLKQNIEIIDVDDFYEKYSPHHAFKPANLSSSNNLAYVIYTSGTTSNPKGVLVEHGNVMNLYCDATKQFFDLWQYSGNATPNKEEAVLFSSNYVFDCSIEQFILSFLCGNKLVIVSKNIPFGSNDFYEYVTANAVTHMSGCPSQFAQLNFAKLSTLKTLMFGGEALQQSHFDRVRRQGYSGIIINVFGLTETTISNFYQIFFKNDPFVSSLGKPIANTRIFVLNDNLQEVAPSAFGKLYISGNSVARGYLNRPEENEKSFIKNVYYGGHQIHNGYNNNVIYNTGDLVRWNKDGYLQYIGRKDFQVNINGLRIEINEIENAIVLFENVKQCAVIVTADSSSTEYSSKRKQIIAYYVSKNNQKIGDIESYLSSKLPIFMIPKHFIQIFDSLPLTSNGKVDKRALPEYNFPELEKKQKITKPSSFLEKKLCEIWQDTLNIPEIGIEEDFFSLGGDSILVMQLAEQIYNEFCISVSFKDIFICRCIKNLATILPPLIQKLEEEETTNNTKNGILDNDFENISINTSNNLLPIQKWFFSKNLINPHHWNQTFTIKAPEVLDFQKLQKACHQLFKLHAAFRLRFKKCDDDEYLQYYAETDDIINSFTLNYYSSINDATTKSIKKIINNSQTKLNIFDGPLFLIFYFDGLADSSSKIIFIMHHLIVDVVSWRIICRDLSKLYHDGAVIRPCMTSYLQWVDCIDQMYSSNSNNNNDDDNSEIKEEKEWWKNLAEKSRNFQKILHESFEFISHMHQRYTFSLTEEQTQLLLRNAIQSFKIKNLNAIFLASLGRALYSLTGEDNIYVTVEGHGRETDHFKRNTSLNLNNTVGWFTSMYPFEISLAKSGYVENDDIENIKSFEAKIPNNGLGYGPLIGYEAAEMSGIFFNYLGQLDKTQLSSSALSWTIDDVQEDYEKINDQTIDGSYSNKSIIDLLAFVTNGKMEFKLDSRLDDINTTKFIQAFKNNIEKIIIHLSDSLKQQQPTMKQNEISTFIPYIELHKNQSKTIFVMPTGPNGADKYSEIIHKFSNFRMILFNNYRSHCMKNGNDKNDAENLTFEELASFYIKYIKALKPKNGSGYSLMGYCFGGVLALEATRQLIDEDEEVENLIIIESSFNAPFALQSIFNELKENVIPKIYFSYNRNKQDYAKVATEVKNIVNFRAIKSTNPTSTTNEDEKKVFDFYANSKHGNLDTLIDCNKFQSVYFEDDSPLSWMHNEKRINLLVNHIDRLFNSK